MTDRNQAVRSLAFGAPSIDVPEASQRASISGAERQSAGFVASLTRVIWALTGPVTWTPNCWTGGGTASWATGGPRTCATCANGPTAAIAPPDVPATGITTTGNDGNGRPGPDGRGVGGGPTGV